VRDADCEQHQQAAHVDPLCVTAGVSPEPLKLDREADREQHAEEAVELAAEKHADGEKPGFVPERRRLLVDGAAEARHVHDQDAEQRETADDVERDDAFGRESRNRAVRCRLPVF
jgi:hypothetical protein